MWAEPFQRHGDTRQLYPYNHYLYFSASYPMPLKRDPSWGSFSKSIGNFQVSIFSPRRCSCTHDSLSVLRRAASPAHCCGREPQRSPSGWYCRTFSYPLHFRALVSCSPQCSFLSEGCGVCESMEHPRLTQGCHMWFHLIFWGTGGRNAGFHLKVGSHVVAGSVPQTIRPLPLSFKIKEDVMCYALYYNIYHHIKIIIHIVYVMIIMSLLIINSGDDRTLTTPKG